PDGNFDSYADRHMEEYFEVVDRFVTTRMEKFSMRAEYKKGSFNPYIRKMLEKMEDVREIQNRYRTNPLKKSWSPWTPICEKCGKIVTTRITEIKDGIVNYICEDYNFEETKAVGCGHRGDNDPLKGNGKLLWKSEWAAQWARWKVVSEGAGKEYQVPNSAWWINGEIVEKVLEFPMPEPIFYEHIVIDNVKMSASLGNVIYPRDWLEVAGPEILRLFYNKRLMTTRSFSWKDLPLLYDEYDYLAKVFHGSENVANKKEETHLKRLYEISSMKAEEPLNLAFSHAAMVAQAFHKEDGIISCLKKTGNYDENRRKRIFDRLRMAKIWLQKYAPEEMKFELQHEVPKDMNLTDLQKEALKKISASLLENDYDDKTLFEEFYRIIKETGVKGPDFFRAAYNVLLNKDRGPKLAPFILAIGKEKAARMFAKI
ncbi:lysine--tRNA ligase, partial [Candidatus Woesearchaeota archaeon]|nr:lysine--tRNA ligase [Candidatus Woesearchaeota archaeon]